MFWCTVSTPPLNETNWVRPLLLNGIPSTQNLRVNLSERVKRFIRRWRWGHYLSPSLSIFDVQNACLKHPAPTISFLFLFFLVEPTDLGRILSPSFPSHPCISTCSCNYDLIHALLTWAVGMRTKTVVSLSGMVKYVTVWYGLTVTPTDLRTHTELRALGLTRFEFRLYIVYINRWPSEDWLFNWSTQVTCLYWSNLVLALLFSLFPL